MHRRQRSLVEFLTRSLALAGLVYALVIAYSVPASVLGPQTSPPAHTDRAPGWWSDMSGQPTWRPAHREQFPGCIDMARWGGQSTPSTVVVVRRDGRPSRMPFGEAFRRARTPSSADDVWTVGACP